MTKRALFLDRDGVINVDQGYVHKSDAVEFVDGIFELVRMAKEAGFLVVLVTNQAGIARGYYSESDFHALMNWMKTCFVQQGSQLDAVYFCPHHPEHGIGEYRRECDCRKPAPGMLLQAQRELDIDMARSIFIGDKPSDMAAGLAAGIGTLLHLNDEANSESGLMIKQLSDALPYVSMLAR